jgi:hypothetical protein
MDELIELLSEAAQYDAHNPKGRLAEFQKAAESMPSDVYQQGLREAIESIRDIQRQLKKYNTHTQTFVTHPVEGYRDGLSVFDALQVLRKADYWYSIKLSYITGKLDFVMPNNQPRA